MCEDDFDQFSELLDGVSDLRGLTYLKPSSKALFFRSVEKYPMSVVQKAIEAHLVDPEAGKFKTQIQPAHIVAQIEGAMANDGRPDADEAWAIAIRAQDEAVTVVWTQEISEALDAARPVLIAGDDVGARMAFKAAYGRLVSKARSESVKPQWMPSLAMILTSVKMRCKGRRCRSSPVVAYCRLTPAPDAVSPDDAAQCAENLAKLRAMLASAISPSEKMRRSREQALKAEREKLSRLKMAQQQLAGEPANDIWPIAQLKIPMRASV